MDKELVELNDFYKRCMDKVSEWGLEPFPVDFHIVPSHKIYEVASYGIPNHFSHWSYGRDYWIQKTQYDHGYARIYELVINANPAQAFLLDTNTLLDNQFVIAHVLGHSDFFRNNAYYAHTNRDIENSAASAAERFREYEIKYGRKVVEEFIDDVFTIKEHIDPHLRVKDTPEDYEISFDPDPYLDMFPDEQQRRQQVEDMERIIKDYMFPKEPQKDLLLFIANNGNHLKDWQKDIILTIRDEMKYFLPQMQTKIMNEGWASIIHHKLMHELDPESDPGGIEFAGIHSSVLSPRLGALNPYWLGYNIYKRIIERWDNPSDEDRDNLGMPGNEGWAKCLEARSIERDETFLRNYLDEQICTDLDLFSYEHFEDEFEEGYVVSGKEWEKVRDTLVGNKQNMGFPYIVVFDADYLKAGGLYLQHYSDGRPLDQKWCSMTLKSVCKLWGRPVFLESRNGDNTIMYSCASPDDAVLVVDDKGSKISYDK